MERTPGLVRANREGTTMAEKKKLSPALMKPVTPSADLAKVVGSTPIPRSEITKKLWEYIKKNDLQDPANKRNLPF